MKYKSVATCLLPVLFALGEFAFSADAVTPTPVRPGSFDLKQGYWDGVVDYQEGIYVWATISTNTTSSLIRPAAK